VEKTKRERLSRENERGEESEFNPLLILLVYVTIPIVGSVICVIILESIIYVLQIYFALETTM
jgi:hypothetical protein